VLKLWNIPSVQRETAPTIENARKALVNNDFGTAHRLLVDVWNLESHREAARLLAKLNLEKLENPLAAVDWLTKLEKLGDARARVELALIGLRLDESNDADVRAADDVAPKGVITRSRVGNQLAKLAGEPATEREALLACFHHDMIETNRLPSCVSSSPFWLFFPFRDTSVERKLNALETTRSAQDCGRCNRKGAVQRQGLRGVGRFLPHH
jgi:hypothetical protein